MIATLDYATFVGFLSAYEEEKVAARSCWIRRTIASRRGLWRPGGRQSLRRARYPHGCDRISMWSAACCRMRWISWSSTDYCRRQVAPTQFDAGGIASAVVAQPWIDRAPPPK